MRILGNSSIAMVNAMVEELRQCHFYGLKSATPNCNPSRSTVHNFGPTIFRVGHSVGLAVNRKASIDHLVDSVNRSFSSTGRSFRQSTIWSVGHSIGVSLGQAYVRPYSRSAIRTAGRSVIWSVVLLAASVLVIRKWRTKGAAAGRCLRRLDANAVGNAGETYGRQTDVSESTDAHNTTDVGCASTPTIQAAKANFRPF